MMRTLLLGSFLMMFTVIPAGAQVVPAPRSLLDSILARPPRVVLEPGFSLLGCCDPQRRLDMWVSWSAEVEPEGLQLDLTAGTATTTERTYSRSGLRARFGQEMGSLRVWGAAGALAGFGSGPRQGLSVTVGMGHPALSLDIRTTWLQNRQQESVMAGSRTSGTPVPPSPGGRYTDAEMRARHQFPLLPAVGLALTAGMRFGELGPDDPGSTWLWGELDLPVVRSLRLVMAGGTRPERPELAEAGGRFVQMGFRLSLNSGQPERDPPEGGPPSDEPLQGTVALLSATGVAPDRYRVSVRAPGARKVGLRGDVTNWRTVALRPVGSDEWEAILETPPGLYRINIRVDGRPWTVPAGIPEVPDRFGGTAGLLELQPYNEEMQHGEETR